MAGAIGFGVNTPTLVSDKFAQATENAEEAFAIALSAMNQVGESDISLDFDEPDEIPIVDAGISGLNPTLPTAPTINPVSVQLATFNEEVPTMRELTQIDTTAPVLNFNYQEGTYNEDLQRPLKAKIIDGIINGGTGLLPETEQAIYDRGLVRQNIDLEAVIAQALNEFASGGARIPQGALIARLDDIRLKAGLRRDDMNFAIIEKSADLGHDYGKFIIQQGIALENELINLFGGIEGRRLDASKFTVSNLVEEFRIRVEASSAQLTGDVEYNKQLMAVFTEQIDLFKAQLDANEKDAEIQYKVEDLKIQTFTSQVTAFNGVVDAITKAYQVEMTGRVANGEMKMRFGELLGKMRTAQAEINAELIKAKGLMAAQLAASWASSVSAGANLGFSQSESENNSSSVSQSINTSNSTSYDYSEVTRNCCNE